MKQQREILRKEKETADKIAARAFAQSYLADLVPSVFGTLSDNGYFYDPVERGLCFNMKWIYLWKSLRYSFAYITNNELIVYPSIITFLHNTFA